ncbi:MAG: peptide ABC transporter substrate-binding protein [Flavobacteriales bacterium]|nr:peptide ABC transporter substrate-binding protein [Flavobacteriales bacterium]
MKIKIAIKCSILFLGIILIACSGNKDKGDEQGSVSQKGDARYGGLFKMNITEEIRSIYPHNMVDASAFNLMNQVYEGLMRINPATNEMETALAEKYEVSSDGKSYTFTLRKGVFFHDDVIFNEGVGREVKAADVVYCFTKLCEPSDRNQLYAFVIDLISGARRHYESGGKTGVAGLRVIDDYTLEIELEYPSPTFLSILTHPCAWIFPKELDKYDSDANTWCIGTGPFKARIIKANDVVILERNKKYWIDDEFGNQLPYIDAVRCNFVTDEDAQLDLFMDGNLDLAMKLPFEKVASLKEDAKKSAKDAGYSIVTIPGLRVEYYGFQHRSDLFGDKRIRQAMNYAVDRSFLVDSILKGYGTAANRGFVPPAMPHYNADAVEGFVYNPGRAQQLMGDAGFPKGDGFPVLTLQLNDGSNTSIEVAEAVQKMLTKNLNITVELSVLPRDMHYDQIEKGNVLFWRDGWIADYPDPENFLKLFHGKLVPDDSVKASYLNTVRFKNTNFDNYFEASLRNSDMDQRMNTYQRADQILIEQAAVLPLYYEKWVWLVKDNIKNLEVGSMGVLDLRKVYKATSTSGDVAAE